MKTKFLLTFLSFIFFAFAFKINGQGGTLPLTIRLDFKHFDWAIFGNPVTSISWIQLQLDRKATVAIQIISIDGKIIQTIIKGNISEGTYSIPLNLGIAPSGTYLIKLVINNQIFSKTVVK